MSLNPPGAHRAACFGLVVPLPMSRCEAPLPVFTALLADRGAQRCYLFPSSSISCTDVPKGCGAGPCSPLVGTGGCPGGCCRLCWGTISALVVAPQPLFWQQSHTLPFAAWCLLIFYCQEPWTSPVTQGVNELC